MDVVSILFPAGIMAVLTVGLFLTVIGLPGNLLILVTALILGWQEEFAHLTQPFLWTLAGIWLGGEFLDFAAGIRGAKKEQGSWLTTVAAMIAAVAGGVLGTGVMPLLGTVLGALLGGLLAGYGVEYGLTGDAMRARRVAWGVFKGQLLGMVVKVAAGIGMVLMVVYRLWFNEL
ncbi:MAG TPA: DUF456 domain-containing protein [Patescibacteria group bacterium]|nr:DUF456 domain-containing protein [Patescibacteria group bacterium]